MTAHTELWELNLTGYEVFHQNQYQVSEVSKSVQETGQN